MKILGVIASIKLVPHGACVYSQSMYAHPNTRLGLRLDVPSVRTYLKMMTEVDRGIVARGRHSLFARDRGLFRPPERGINFPHRRKCYKNGLAGCMDLSPERLERAVTMANNNMVTRVGEPSVLGVLSHTLSLDSSLLVWLKMNIHNGGPSNASTTPGICRRLIIRPGLIFISLIRPRDIGSI